VVSSQHLHEAPANIAHEFVKVRGPNAKPLHLAELLASAGWQRCIVFVNSTPTLAWAAKFMEEKGFTCASLGGAMSKTNRAEQLQRFRSGAVDTLVATDVAARGLDIPEVRF
jgi:superfamily II DNA/RNA helicase